MIHICHLDILQGVLLATVAMTSIVPYIATPVDYHQDEKENVNFKTGISLEFIIYFD